MTNIPKVRAADVRAALAELGWIPLGTRYMVKRYDWSIRDGEYDAKTNTYITVRRPAIEIVRVSPITLRNAIVRSQGVTVFFRPRNVRYAHWTRWPGSDWVEPRTDDPDIWKPGQQAAAYIAALMTQAIITCHGHCPECGRQTDFMFCDVCGKEHCRYCVDLTHTVDSDG